MPSIAPPARAGNAGDMVLRRARALLGLRIGLLPTVCVLFAGLALAVRVGAGMPGGYDWVRPFKDVWNVASSPGFPVYVAATLAIAATMRDVRARARGKYAALRSGGSLSRKALAKSAAAAAAACALSFWVLPRYGHIDRALTAALAAVLVLAVSSRSVARFLAQTALVVGCFWLATYGFTVFKALLFEVVQPRDAQILAVERALFGGNAHRATAAWAAQNPAVVIASDDAYFFLFDRVVFVPIFLLAVGRPAERTEYFGSVIFAYCIGALSYYVWPGLGPIFHEPELYEFLTELPLDTNHFRRALSRNTTLMLSAPRLIPFEYIACMPSLHVTFDLIILYYSRASPVALALSALFSISTLVSVVVLGWHYPIDVIGGAMVAAVAIALARRYRGELLPFRDSAAESGSRDEMAAGGA